MGERVSFSSQFKTQTWSRQQELEAMAHVASTNRKQGATDAKAQLALFCIV